jgi:thiol-disulfide isomerase/thioredoxin
LVGIEKRSLWVLWLLSLGCATAGRTPAAPAEPAEVRLLDGSQVSWPSLLATSGDTLVVFATPWCEICRRERPEVQDWARANRERIKTIYVFSGGKLPGVVDEIRSYHLDTDALTVVVDNDGRLADRYAIQATPTLLVLGPQGLVLSTQHRFEPKNLN